MTKKAAVAKLDKGGEHFEILIDPDAALEFKMGKPMGIDKILIHEEIFKDAKKGLRASEQALKRIFGTTDVRKIAEIIIKEGEIPLTAEQRRRLIEDKKRQIVEWISRNCIDVRTKTPVPPQRVENALDQVRVSIDPFKPPEEQVQEILKEIQRVLPIKVATARIALSVSSTHAQKVKGIVAKMAKIVNERYKSDGSWEAVLELPAGLQDVLISKVNDVTHGDADIRIVEIVF
ncbi:MULTISPECIES: ribosome assembly factor SBDS [Pyrobaculum]|uniref:Shwachman-Bodian-Diamond syndrome protein n=3 Tax=Pyrobaculum TaxID=2276 RepID=A4WM65_PYRAR|nr:ribosome assembly factor SBDS [Pyrobaculum arsenaticum]ABP51482.1 Shwachman-Bodian-Diamond syndrome protein [Pyrobaculum arsenaticum DSM 13514]AFA38215.1 rRNA metabolism protein, SBDS family [Pyrobaculum oguniense TE7]MCY0890959.1 ribosome assembly factor SBDS [Pyrobaculum arsenaticum]NYR16549.1 ribosome assembly factor SBDS [Pyrobaculum arsenaticum]